MQDELPIPYARTMKTVNRYYRQLKRLPIYSFYMQEVLTLHICGKQR